MTCYREELEYNIAFAKAVVKERGKLSPMVVGIVGRERLCFPFFFRDDEELKVQTEIIKAELRKAGATALVVLTEAWYLKLRHPALYSPAYQRPKDHPDRKECLVIFFITKVASVRAIIPFTRVLDTIEFGQETRLHYKTVNDEQWGDLFFPQKKGS